MKKLDNQSLIIVGAVIVLMVILSSLTYYGPFGFAPNKTGIVNVTVGGIAGITLTVDVVDFGTIPSPTSLTYYNTTDCNATTQICTVNQNTGPDKNITPFVVNNTGTAYINVSLLSGSNVTTFLGNASNKFQFQVRENLTTYDNLTTACSRYDNGANDTWVNITSGNAGSDNASYVSGCSKLNYTGDSMVEYHIRIGVDSGTTIGSLRKTNLTFQGVGTS